LNIVIVGHFLFPTGSAAASRMRYFARGLRELGHDVRVMTMTSPRIDSDDAPDPEWSDWNGIPYLHAAGWVRPRDARSLPRRLTHLVTRIRRTAHAVCETIHAQHKSEGVDIDIGYTCQDQGFTRIHRCCRDLGIPIVHDVVEWLGPDSFYYGKWNPLYWDSERSFRSILPKANGIIAISSYLERYFKGCGLPVVRMPAIIDCDVDAPPPDTAKVQDADRFVVTYLGNMVERDGPMLMVDAVREVVAEGHDIALHVVGGTDRIPEARRAQAIVEADEQLRDRVTFFGRVSDEMVRRHLWTSDALLFTRRMSRAGSAAFPTRLPEYLVTGRPVIASDVSDIAEFLRDGEDAIIVAPDSASAIADGIERLLARDDRGAAIGASGKRRCAECFHYLTRTRQVVDFIEESVLAPRGAVSSAG